MSKFSTSTLSLALAAVLTAPAAWAAVTITKANAPSSGVHVQTGTPGCSLDGFVVTCAGYELAGAANTSAVAALSVSYTGTVLCKNKGGNVAPGQTTYPTLTTSSPPLTSDQSGRITVPAISSPDQPAIEAALIQGTSCPNGNWADPYVETGSIRVSGYTYTLTFTGFTNAFIRITP